MAIELQRDVVVDGYRLDNLLGSGGFGAVWRATTLHNGREVAIKFLHASVDRAGEQRFDLEARILARFSHSNCVTLLNHGRVPDGPIYLVTEYLGGRTLREWCKGGRSPAEAVFVARQIADALIYAHDLNVVHRDLKPANVLVVESPGAPLHVKVLDFGLAKLTESESADITKTGEIIGTPGFMSPEQMRGRRDIGPATDQYCLGVILFELLTGRHPYHGDTAMALGMAHLVEPVPPLGGVAPALAAIVHRMLQKAPEARFRSMQDVARALDDCFTTAPATTPVRAPSSRALVIAGTALLAAAIGFGLVRPFDDASMEPERRRRAVPFVKGQVPEVGPSPKEASDAGPDLSVTARAAFKTGWDEQGINYVRYPTEPKYRAIIALLPPSTRNQPIDFLEYVGLESEADAQGLILFALDAEPLRVGSVPVGGAWENGNEQEAWRSIRKLVKRHEVPLFILAEARGARGAQKMLCDLADRGEIAAVAVTGHRMTVEEASEFRCETPVPYLNLVQLKSAYHPIDGGHRCGETKRNIDASVDDHERHWKQLNGCDRTARAIEHTEGMCLWSKCDVPFGSCRIDGGQKWRHRTRPRDHDDCHGDPSEKFPYRKVVVDFFLEQLPKEQQ